MGRKGKLLAISCVPIALRFTTITPTHSFNSTTVLPTRSHHHTMSALHWLLYFPGPAKSEAMGNSRKKKHTVPPEAVQRALPLRHDTHAHTHSLTHTHPQSSICVYTHAIHHTLGHTIDQQITHSTIILINVSLSLFPRFPVRIKLAVAWFAGPLRRRYHTK